MSDYQIYSGVVSLIAKYLIPVLATNFFTDVAGRFVPLRLKYTLLPVISIFFAGISSFIYGYIEEETFRATVEHGFIILTISGILFISGGYNTIKKRLVNLIDNNIKGDKDGKPKC